jgi:hypothetical protein
MAITITNQAGALKFSFNTERNRLITHGHILQCDAWRETTNKKWMIKVITADGARFIFKYEDVSSPTTTDAHDLANLILTYNSGGGDKQIYYATAGQTVFTTTFYLGSNVDVYINGAFQAAGFTWTDGTTTVTFATPFTGGEEVIIISR